MRLRCKAPLALHFQTLARLDLPDTPPAAGEPPRPDAPAPARRPHFKWVALRAKAHYGDACMVCGWREDVTDVHHIVGRAEGGTDDLDNLVVLCPNHHRMADKGRLTVDRLRELVAQAGGSVARP